MGMNLEWFDPIEVQDDKSTDPWWIDYSAYLESPAWERLREKILERDGHMCAVCWSPADVVHHISYKDYKIGNPMDLVSLCHECHQAIHEDKEAGYNWEFVGRHFVPTGTSYGRVSLDLLKSYLYWKWKGE